MDTKMLMVSVQIQVKKTKVSSNLQNFLFNYHTENS